MVLNDPLANALSGINNCEHVSKTLTVVKPTNKVIKRVLDIMNTHNYVGTYTEIKDSKGDSLEINLIGGLNKCGVIKPHFSVKKDGYEKFEKRYLPAKNMGIIIVSTSQGIMTHLEAKQKNIGGKLLAYCY
ncbi:30S ribosomal protein S8 [Candidatus Woesearchaeota archaeon]|nr:30S ribosomal protein S8 [Candidatus Woesearchaeota archaeon]